MHNNLKRYWFVIYPEARYGPYNAGVTAENIAEAKRLLLKNFERIGYDKPLERLKETKDVEVIENIDVRLLDENHVIPNMGPVVFKGVWYPPMNMHDEV
jgi:hypothetical protein